MGGEEWLAPPGGDCGLGRPQGFVDVGVKGGMRQDMLSREPKAGYTKGCHRISGLAWGEWVSLRTDGSTCSRG